MDKQAKAEIARDLIISGKIRLFKDIFAYVEKKYIHEQTGMNYYRLLRIVAKPKLARFEDVYSIAHALKVSPRAVSELIHNQIEFKHGRKP